MALTPQTPHPTNLALKVFFRNLKHQRASSRVHIRLHQQQLRRHSTNYLPQSPWQHHKSNNKIHLKSSLLAPLRRWPRPTLLIRSTRAPALISTRVPTSTWRRSTLQTPRRHRLLPMTPATATTMGSETSLTTAGTSRPDFCFCSDSRIPN